MMDMILFLLECVRGMGRFMWLLIIIVMSKFCFPPLMEIEMRMEDVKLTDGLYWTVG